MRKIEDKKKRAIYNKKYDQSENGRIHRMKAVLKYYRKDDVVSKCHENYLKKIRIVEETKIEKEIEEMRKLAGLDIDDIKDVRLKDIYEIVLSKLNESGVFIE